MGFYFEELFSKDGEPIFENGKKTVLYDIKTGNITTFDMGEETWGADLNDLGEVAGLIKGSNGKFTGFFGTPHEFVKIPGFDPIALNNCGQIIGRMLHSPNKHAPAIWEMGKLTLMSDLTLLWMIKAIHGIGLTNWPTSMTLVKSLVKASSMENHMVFSSSQSIKSILLH